MERGNVLIVEDEGIIQVHLKVMLQKQGYCVRSTGKGEDAIRMISEEQPDIVLLDVHLKGSLTGVDVYTRACVERSIPVIFLTAYDPAVVLSGIVNCRYINKPYDEFDVLAMLRQTLDAVRKRPHADPAAVWQR